MRRARFALFLVAGLLLAACAEFDKAFPLAGYGNPPLSHIPGKADLVTCTKADCPLIPVNIQVDDGKCTVPFLFQRVDVQPGATARFAFAVLTPEYIFRFTDPGNDANTSDAARHLPAIDIDYRGMPPAFSVGYADASTSRDRPVSQTGERTPEQRSRMVRDVDITRYVVTALPAYANKHVYYRFRIHAEWSADRGATWLPCEVKDPVIANN